MLKQKLKPFFAGILMSLPLCTTAFADGDLIIKIPEGMPSLNGTAGNTVEQFQKTIDAYSGIETFVVSAVLLFLLGALILNITKLAKSRDNEQDRRGAIKGILLTGVAIALIGALSTIVALTHGLAKM